MAVTLTNLRDSFYDILREEQDSNAYPYTLVDLMLNNVQKRICSGRIVNPFTGQGVRKGRLPFLSTDSFYSNVSDTSLSAAVAVGGGTLTVTDASNFPSTGSLYIAGNIVTYTGTTATTFTGCSNVLFAFTSGQAVSIAFDVPTDYMDPISVTYQNKIRLDAKLYDDIFEDLNRYKGNQYQRNTATSPYESPYRIPPFYTIKDGSKLLIFNLSDTLDMVLFRYNKLPSVMSAASDTATIDDDEYAKVIIPLVTAGEVLYHRGEEKRAAEILNYGLGQVKEMYAFYDNQTMEEPSGKQYRAAKGQLNI